MFGLSMGEILLLAIIALIVIGPKQLPEFARQVARVLGEIKRAAGDFSSEVKRQASVIDPHQTVRPPEARIPETRPPENKPPEAKTVTPRETEQSYSQHIAVEDTVHQPSGRLPEKKDTQS
jgi:sec-independent protein translocase protein TatB